MKTFFESIKNFDYIDLIIGCILTYFLGLLTEKLIKKYKKLKIQSNRRKYVCNKSNYFEENGIVSLDHGDPYYNYSNLCTIKTEEYFYLSIPENFLSKMHEIDSDFISRPETLLNQFSWESYAQEINVPNLKDLVEKQRIIIAERFLSELTSGKTFFNGEKFGVRHIRSDREGQNENAKLNIKFYNTDYYTHWVMSAVYEELKEQNHQIIHTKTISDINKFYLFTSSFGVNTLVVLEETDTLILAKRSGELWGMNGIDRWHVSMNEGLSVTDEEANIIDLKQCVRRGLREELGISKQMAESHISFNEFDDLFLVKDNFQIGITNIVKIGITYEELQRKYLTAKDKELETTELVQLNLSEKDITNFLNNHKSTLMCEYNLNMLMGRIESLNL